MPGSARERLLDVRAGSGPGADRLTPGRDLVLHVATEHGLALPRGVALDDHLDHDARALVDSRAWERWARWRERRASALRVEGLDLAAIWQIELLARCFFPAARIEVGLPRALEAAGAGALAAHDLGAGPEAVLRAVAAAAGVRVVEGGGRHVAAGDGAAGPPRASRALAERALAAAGVPGLVRGQVLCVPYWNLTPVYEHFVRRPDGLRPAAAGVILPGLDSASTLRAAVRGGWLGHPGPRARHRAASDVGPVIDAAHQDRAPDDAVDAALDDWALALLESRAPATLAAARRARRAFARGRVRVLLVPFDRTNDAAVLVDEARRAGIPSLLVQHGFDSRMGAPDKDRADVVALWSERDRSAVPSGSTARLAVTGNPGAERLVARGARVERRDRTLVLVDYPSRLSARITERVGHLHVRTALEALGAARSGTTAVIRPHPSDRAGEAYLRIPTELRVELDPGAPIEQALAEVDLCIGSMSTATLQAGAVGVPVVHLEVAGYRRPWPLDGGTVPSTRDRDELAAAVAVAVADGGVAGQPEMIEALGVRRGATAAVCELIDGLAAGSV